MLKRRRLKYNNEISAEILEDILRENEISANLFIAKALIVVGALSFVDFMIFGVEASLGKLQPLVWIMLYVLVFACIVTGIAVIHRKGNGIVTKSVLLITVLGLAFGVSVYGVYGYWCCLYLPILLSIRYYDHSLTIRIGIASILAMILSSVIGISYGLAAHILPIEGVKIPDGFKLVVENGLTETLYQYDLIKYEDILSEQIMFIVPYFVMYLILIGIALILVNWGKKNILKSANLTLEIQQKERDIEETKMKVMISQLQPHFLYNSLSAIMAIDDNPPETVEALADFSKYLRGNLDSLKVTSLIPFRNELAHVERYISLEKLRFGDDLNFETELNSLDFELPPLTLQMAVENAVKHGLFPKNEKGTIAVSTSEDDNFYYIKVSDDGVGFNPNDEKYADGTHVGIINSRKRIQNLCGGSYEIKSEMGKGTEVTISIRKRIGE